MHRRFAPVARSNAAKLGLTGLVAFALFTSALQASAAENQVTVYPSDLSSTNASSERTKWDATGVSKFAEFPEVGTKWALDIENKPKGSATIDGDGLILSVTGETQETITKIRYQYYVGTGGYPAVDAQSPILADVFAAPLGWDQTYLSGAETLGTVLQIQLEKETTAGVYDRVTVTNVSSPGTGERNFGSGLWFSNSDIHADGYKQGDVILPANFGLPGVSPEVLEKNFGEFTVVSFGPNLGRDKAYDYRIQDFTILGQTFHFTVDTTAPVVAITGGASASTNDTTPTITGTTDASVGTIVTVTVAGQTLTTTVQTGGTWSVMPGPLTVGTNAVVVSVTDPALNTGTASQTLMIMPGVSTSSTVSVSPSGSALAGTAVAVTGTVSPVTAIGSIEIFDGTTSLGEGDVTDGVFTLETSALAVGNHSFTAMFTPTNVESYLASTSAAVTFSVNKKELPVEPPSTSTEQLEVLIETQNLDVPGTTDSFVPSGDTTNNALDSLDVSKLFSGTLPWSDGADSFVDVYAYSSPVFLGTFPVVNGVVQITGVDLSALEAGGHNLVFVGQTSGTVSVMAVTVAAPVAAPVIPARSSSGLAVTGVDPAVSIGAAGILLLLGLGSLIPVARRRRA
ncbi:Ig-like domain repeat protein [Cryobacterium sp. N19]|uniref:Ig-like domain repeat protein n=1 Tax=Cryobacterium sp. N19 TaxID=2048288 RepID=UPI001304EEB4|nr:Ig-like domain repeat protein [Cryobacterium sp. N19]